MSEGGFLAILERSKLHLRSQDEDVSAIRADLLSSSLLSSPLGSSSEVDSYLKKCTASTEKAAIELQEKDARLLQSIDGLLKQLKKQKGVLRGVPEEIETTEDALMELYNELEGTRTDNEASNTSFRQSLEKQLSSLQQLYEARDYLSVLAKAEDLATKAVTAEKKEVKVGQEDSISLLKELNALVNKTQTLLNTTTSSGGSVSTLKLIPFIRSQRSHAFSQLTDIRRKRLSTALEGAGWPLAPIELEAKAKVAQISSESVLVESNIIKLRWKELMQLQRQCEKLKILPATSSRLLNKSRDDTDRKPEVIAQAGSQDFQPLLACQCLLAPLLLRFYYHFDSTRSTNRLDKPEWYLTHMLNILRSNSHLFHPISGPISSLCSNKSIKSPNGYRYDLYAELLHGILRPLVVKLESSIPLLLEHSSLLSHTIIQTVQFDQDLRDILPQAEPSSPIRLAEILLSNQAVFEAWVQSEREFALERLYQEMESGAAWSVGDGNDTEESPQQDSWTAMIQEGGPSTASNIDGDDPASGLNMKTTRSAQAVITLLDGLTKRYQALPTLNLQLPFLLIQSSLLQLYAQRLDRSLDAFESMSSAFSRTIPGAIAVGGSPGPEISLNSEGDMVRGLRGLGRLLKAALSAIYISRLLSDLSSASFYLEMGSQMNSDQDGLKALSQFKHWQGSEEERELDKASLGELVRRGWKSSSKVASGFRPLGGGSPKARTNSLPRVSKTSLEKDASSHTDVWENMRARYDQIASRSLKGIEKLVVSEVLDGLRTYAHRCVVMRSRCLS